MIGTSLSSAVSSRRMARPGYNAGWLPAHAFGHPDSNVAFPQLCYTAVGHSAILAKLILKNFTTSQSNCSVDWDILVCWQCRHCRAPSALNIYVTTRYYQFLLARRGTVRNCLIKAEVCEPVVQHFVALSIAIASSSRFQGVGPNLELQNSGLTSQVVRSLHFDGSTNVSRF